MPIIANIMVLGKYGEAIDKERSILDMTDSERKILGSFINSRLEIALKRLDENTDYLEQCRQQEKSGEAAEALLHKLEKEERITIRRHYEGETAKTGFELDEAYLQGLRDSIKILAFLGVFSVESSL